jgi:hypothetical protein
MYYGAIRMATLLVNIFSHTKEPGQGEGWLTEYCALTLQAGAVAVAPKKKLVAGKDIKAQQFKVGDKTIALGFTKSNELFVGRLAMIGVATSIIGEVRSHQNVTQCHALSQAVLR